MQIDTDIYLTMSDGVKVAVRVYRPDHNGQVPALFAASPYRYDNDDVPETGMFLWHEIGPLRWYVEQGYAYVRLDVRGTGKSEGEYGYFDRRERRDLYEVVEWIAEQAWSNGRIGGFGQSYYAHSQWCMAAERPPHLTCIAPYDGHIDIFGGWCYPGGIPSAFISAWWNTHVRAINRAPAGGAPAREIAYDLPYHVSRHPTFDDYWSERSISKQLSDVEIPVYSIGVWSKLDLHLNGNILGYQKVRGPKKLKISGAAAPILAHKEFSSTSFHENVLLPFYDHYLKALPTRYVDRPPVEYYLRGQERTASAKQWPPEDAAVSRLYLGATHSGSVTSLNDGCLTFDPSDEVAASTSYSYPDQQWAIGHVAIGPQGPDPVRRVLTFTSPPLSSALVIAGPAELVLFASSSQSDADFIVKLSEQFDQSPQQTLEKLQPAFAVVTKGWLRASHRAVDAELSNLGAPVLAHHSPSDLMPHTIYELRIPLMPAAYRFKQGSRIRLEIACADSPITDSQFYHIYTPNRIGTDTVYHTSVHPSHLALPVLKPDENPQESGVSLADALSSISDCRKETKGRRRI